MRRREARPEYSQGLRGEAGTQKYSADFGEAVGPLPEYSRGPRKTLRERWPQGSVAIP
jgi:hypothetical protein